MALTKQDKNWIKNSLAENNKEIFKFIADNNQAMSEHFASKIDLSNLKDELVGHIKKLKSEVLNYIDSFAKEIKDNREQRTVQAEQTIRNTRRIEKLEKHVFS